MPSYSSLIRNIILPLSDVVLRRTISKHFNFLMESQWWSKNDLKEYQNSKLRELIKYSYENVEYYNNLFKVNKLHPADIKTREDLYKIPILTKEDIRRNYPDTIVAKSYTKKLVYKGSSSGSTGKPLQYLVSKDSYSFNIACNLRGWYWMGYRFGDKFVKINVTDRPWEKQIQDRFLRTKYLAYSYSEEDMEKIISDIKNYRPKIIRSFPDPLFFIAKFMLKNNINEIEPEILTTTGNTLLPHIRSTIESQFGCKIFDSYRCEGGANAFENPSHETYLSSMEYGISEILFNDKEVGPGEKGRHVTTDLWNYAMPFIRYDSQDIIVKGKEKCKSGRNLMTIDKIEGRDSDILITPNNKFLIVHNFTGFFQDYEGVNQFQIRQTKIDHFIILLVVNKFFNNSHKNEIHDYWSNQLGVGVDLEIQIVKEIKMTPGGKRRFLIRDKKINLPF